MTTPVPASTNTTSQHPPAAPHRIGLYGGAFDPPHLAHVALAAAAVQQLGLDCLYIIPTGQPWMKLRQLTPAPHRLHMAQAAFASVPQAVVDDCELRRNTTTYTIDTLRELQQRHAMHAQAAKAPANPSRPKNTDTDTATTGHIEWFLIMGQDLLQTLPQWQRADELLREVTIAVQTRPQDCPQTGTTHNKGAATRFTRTRECKNAEKIPGLRLVQLHLPDSTISSTAIRQGLKSAAQQTTQARQNWLQTLVTPAVARYIEHHQLYFSHNEL